MNKEEILAMEVGEELDKLVAVEVMGEPMPEFTPGNALGFQLAGSPVKSPKGNWLCLCRYDEGDIPMWRPVPFSTDISAAWLVVEKLGGGKDIDQISVVYELDFGEWKYRVTIDYQDLDKQSVTAWGKTPPVAICKAALLTRLDEIKKLEGEEWT